MSPRRGAAAALLLATLALPRGASAHLVTTRFGDFYGGLLHPLTALEHCIPWLALGLLAGWQGARSGRWTLLAFPIALLCGTLAGGWPPPPLSPGLPVAEINIGSFVVLGALLALAWRFPLALMVLLGLLFGLSHGLANGTAAPTAGSPLPFAVGVATAGYLMVAPSAAAAVVIARHPGWPQIALRTAGSWISAIGIMMLALILAPAAG